MHWCRALLAGAALSAVTVASASIATASAAPPPVPQPATASTWSTQMQFTGPDGKPWPTSAFAALKSDGMNTAEVNMEWATLEPQRGTFDFSVLDTELAHAQQAGIALVPIFWQSQWGGNPAPWITDFEVSDNGTTGNAPAWWDQQEQRDYFDYITTTVKHIGHFRSYGGSILDYGWLDAQWHANSGVGGYARADIDEFHRWLPSQYRDLAAFNRKYGTAYASWDRVPAARAGDPLFSVYQEFRVWSVEDTYGRLTAAVRRISAAPLFYYYGGHLGNARDFGNLPDIFFRLARRYHVTVIEDAADSTGLSLFFGSLARSYGVPLMQEWTARDSGLKAEAGQWLAHYGFAMPAGAGEDFFIHDGTDKDLIGYPAYTGWLPHLKSLQGSYPQQPVAVYVRFAYAHGDPQAQDTNSAENAIAAAWSRSQVGFTVVTDEEVTHHVVDLSKFKAVLPMNGTDAYLQRYAARGGHLLSTSDQLTDFATPYASLSAAHVVEAVPTVAPDRRRAALAIAEVNQFYDYSGSITVNPAGLGLRSGTYHLVDSAGHAMAQKAVPGGVCAPAPMPSAQLQEWDVVPGAAPKGTPAPSQCPIAGAGARSVTDTAGQEPDGLMMLLIGNTGLGHDGNLRSATVDGRATVQTWTAQESQAGCGCANVYLQLDPNSAVAQSSGVDVTVTYLAVAGQGFQVQYDGAQAPYENGPTVTSPGTGDWTTATVHLSDARFDELQNESADLRLQATDATQPLTISSITLSTPGG